MKTENTRSRAGIHIPEFRRSLPAVLGKTRWYRIFQQAAAIMGSGSVRECLFGRQAGIRQKEA